MTPNLKSSSTRVWFAMSTFRRSRKSGGNQGDDLAKSIQSAVSGAISSALAPVLQNLQSSTSSDVLSDDDDFVSDTSAKRR